MTSTTDGSNSNASNSNRNSSNSTSNSNSYSHAAPSSQASKASTSSGLMHSIRKTLQSTLSSSSAADSENDADFIATLNEFKMLNSNLIALKTHVDRFSSCTRTLFASTCQVSEDFATLIKEIPRPHSHSDLLISIAHAHSELSRELAASASVSAVSSSPSSADNKSNHLTSNGSFSSSITAASATSALAKANSNSNTFVMINALVRELDAEFAQHQALQSRIDQRVKLREEYLYYKEKLDSLLQERKKRNRAEKPAETEKIQRNQSKFSESKAAFLSFDQQLSNDLMMKYAARLRTYGPLLSQFVTVEKRVARAFYSAINQIDEYATPLSPLSTNLVTKEATAFFPSETEKGNDESATSSYQVLANGSHTSIPLPQASPASIYVNADFTSPKSSFSDSEVLPLSTGNGIMLPVANLNVQVPTPDSKAFVDNPWLEAIANSPLSNTPTPRRAHSSVANSHLHEEPNDTTFIDPFANLSPANHKIPSHDNPFEKLLRNQNSTPSTASSASSASAQLDAVHDTQVTVSDGSQSGENSITVAADNESNESTTTNHAVDDPKITADASQAVTVLTATNQETNATPQALDAASESSIIEPGAAESVVSSLPSSSNGVIMDSNVKHDQETEPGI